MDKAAVASYAVNGAACFLGTLTATEIAAYGGLILGTLTFLVNVVYRHLDYMRTMK